MGEEKIGCSGAYPVSTSESGTKSRPILLLHYLDRINIITRFARARTSNLNPGDWISSRVPVWGSEWHGQRIYPALN
jgi:hypothetical protein